MPRDVLKSVARHQSNLSVPCLSISHASKLSSKPLILQLRLLVVFDQPALNVQNGTGNLVMVLGEAVFPRVGLNGE